MSMRYLVRTENPKDIDSIKKWVADLDNQLPPAAANLKRHIRVPISPCQTALFSFYTQKTKKGFEWYCPSIELSAESEPLLIELLKKFGVDPKRLVHLKGTLGPI